MSVELLDTPRFHGYRVRRQIDGKTYQEYFSLKADGRRIRGPGKGRVRGILFRMKTEKSGTRTPVFQIGIMSTLANKIVNTTVSINLHGLEGAWRKAVDFYIAHKKISKRSKVYRELLAAKPSDADLRRLMARQRGRARRRR
jgi:hypothetical protein